ncbi:MAG TPA: TRAP transporter small permease [Paenirhodobacter sp.]
MNAFQNGVYGLSRAAAALAALIIVAMTLHILLEIVLRSFFARSTFVLDEMVGYGIATATFLSLGYAFEQSSLIRVGVLVDRLHGRARRTVDAVCAVLMLAMMGLVGWHLGSTVLRSFAKGRKSSSLAEVPLWIPEFLCWLGILILCLQVFAYFCRQLSGHPGPVPRAIGTGQAH